jgi:hypothetical protein
VDFQHGGLPRLCRTWRRHGDRTSECTEAAVAVLLRHRVRVFGAIDCPGRRRTVTSLCQSIPKIWQKDTIRLRQSCVAKGLSIRQHMLFISPCPSRIVRPRRLQRGPSCQWVVQLSPPQMLPASADFQQSCRKTLCRAQRRLFGQYGLLELCPESTSVDVGSVFLVEETYN